MATAMALDSDEFRDHSEHPEPSYQDSNRQLEDQDPNLGRSVYRQCWQEFYNWEPHGCQQFIAELSPDRPDNVDLDKYNDVLASCSFLGEYAMAMDIDDDRTDPVCIVRIYDKQKAYSDVRLSFEEVKVAKIDPYPTYESCPPASKCMTSRHYEHPETYETPFIPYADEDEFDAVEYQAECYWLSWQVDWKDPDIEVIQLEAARRLHFEHGLSFADIDRLGFLGVLRANNQSGLLWDNFQRDTLRWPGAVLSHLPEFTTTFEGDQSGENIIHNVLKPDLQARINLLLRSFCPNLNCVQPACPTHSSPYPAFDPIKPTKTLQEMFDGDPCSEECFRHTDSNLLDPTYWENPTDEATLATILDITPDLLPCELAVLCRKPCREVYVQRMKLHPDAVIIESRALEVPKSRTSRPTIYLDMKPMEHDGHLEFTPLHPCHHKGPCDLQSNCRCFMGSLHCTRNCRCSWKCKIRWKGCPCKGKPKRCIEKCKCMKAGRECDIDLCKDCGLRPFAAGRSIIKCHNIKIQQGKPKTIVIRRGKYGLGAFTDANVAPNDYLGEYIGKIFSKDEAAPYSAVNHRGLNYNFTLNETQVIDAVACGNNTRYINHGNGPDVNCEARIFLVNGDHRIGFFATKRIYPRQELLFDYGEAYWKSDEHVSE